MTPTYGKCKDCAAWTCEGDPSFGRCQRGPSTVRTCEEGGCWSFLPRLRADAFPPLTPEQQRQADELIRRWAASQTKPSHEAREDVGKDGEVEE